MPHGTCYQWRPDILWLNVFSDSIIAFAYFAIPAALFYFTRRKPKWVDPSIVYMFCIFILACGVTHAFGIWTVWNGQYGIHGLIKAFTAASSVVAAVMLYPIIPKLLVLRTPGELERANLELQKEIEQRRQSEQITLKLQEELARYARITTVGQMATGLAHELNQPLLAISASTDTAVQVAKSLPETDPLIFECLDDIQNDTHRAGEIIRTLRQFVSKKSTDRTLVDINKLATQAIQLVTADAQNSDINLVLKSKSVPAIEANSVQIAQVLVNLLRNAVEAISGAASSNKQNQKPQITIESEYNGSDVLISVEDNGPGIESSLDPFEMYESEKEDGIGVGLSISRDIVEAHGGKLNYSSKKPSGARFTFSIPVVAFHAVN